ncbi:MAG: Gfo/Idh/MocA family oxidoreductase [Pseudomonadota bacterium]
MIRWGVLSSAKIGVTHAIPALSQAEGCDVIAIASRTAVKAHEIAARFGIPNAYDSYEALLASDEIDAVYVPLPSSHHVEWSRKAAEAGKHVLCEKPMALQASDIDHLIAVRDANAVVVSEAMMAIYHPQWQLVRELIADGAIGALRQVTASFAYHNVDPENIRNRIDTGGGALPDIGCYPVATTRFATGASALRAMAHIQRDPAFGTDVHVAAIVDFGDFTLSMQVGTQMAWRQTASFHGELGFIDVSAPFNAVPGHVETVRLFRDARQVPETFTFEDVNQYRLQFEAFARAVTKTRSNALLSLEDSRQTQLIIDALYRSAETNQWRPVT